LFRNAQAEAHARRGASGGSAGGATGTGSFRDIFSQFFKGGGGEAAEPTPEKGADLEYALNIGFWEAIKGKQKKVEIPRLDQRPTGHGTGGNDDGSATCPECNGTGNVSQMAGNMRFNLTCPRCGGKGRLKNVCPTCRGEGRTAHTETVEILIPA